MAKLILSVDRVRDLFDCDPERGVLMWSAAAYRRPRGRIVGCPNESGYICVIVDGKKQYAHRLIWAHVHGAWPEDLIDHVNGDCSDNRISNLRPATKRQNSQNVARKSGASGVPGVTWDKQTGMWRAQLRDARKVINVGRFKDLEAARQAHLQAKRLHHEYGRF